MARTRWIFAGQLGPQFDDGGRMLLIEARSVFARAPMHRAKAHLLLSAMRHRAAELGDRVDFHQVERYSDVVGTATQPGPVDPAALEVIDPTSWAARAMVRRLGLHVLPSRGFVTSEQDFAMWAGARGGKRLLLEDFYRTVRQRTGILMEGESPAGGQWNYDADNRQSPPKNAISLGLPDPWWPTEDAIDEQVREDLDRWVAEGAVTLVGDDGPRRFAATAAEAASVVADFVESRLNDFGPFEDATLTGDWTMAHSLLSAPMNLGLIDPREVVETVAAEYTAGRAPLSSVEGFVRQVMGWRDYVWHLYWHLGEDYSHTNNALRAHQPMPAELLALADGEIEMNCLSHTIEGGTPARLGAPHPAADDHRQLVAAARLRSAAAERLVYQHVCRRHPLGDAGECDRDVPARRRRRRRHQALCLGRRLYQQDDGLLRGMPLQPEGAARPGRVPVHRRLLGVPRPHGTAAARQPPDGAAARGASTSQRPRGRGAAGTPARPSVAGG